jgi:peptidyl-prolyl cis-trans isomerase D
MAVIQKIRDKYAKLAGGVIAVALIGFVVNDAFSGKSGSMFGSNSALAKVEGSKIEPLEYDQHVREYMTMYSLSNNGKQVDDNTRTQIYDQSLRDLVYEKIVDKQLAKLGLEMTAAEEKELIYGNEPSPMIMNYPAFTNPESGAFDPSRIKAYEQQLKSVNSSEAEKERETWNNFKSYVLRQHKLQKFNSMVAGSLYAPKYMVDYKLQNQGELVSVRMVKVPNTIIPDNEVSVTDADIKAYLEKNKSKFRIDEPARSIEYVTFDVDPSKEDTLAAETALVNLKAEFSTLPDAEVESFVTRNSEGQYRDFYFTKKTFTSTYADSILNKPAGTVYGPYLEANTFLLVKVLEHKSLPDSVKAQHILIQPSQALDDSAAHRMADSLKLAVERGANFDSLALSFSADKSNAEKGGDLGYFAYGTMVPEFNDAGFLGKTGDIKVVKTQFGYHIIRITDQKNFGDAIKLAIINKPLFPSDVTETNVYAKATEFSGKYSTAKGFDDGVKAMGIQKRVADDVKIHDFSAPGLGASRELVRWMYDAKPGDVSPIIKLAAPNTRYLVAKLTGIQETGSLKVDPANRPMIESMVKAEKKAEKIIEKFKGQTSLDAIAQASGQNIVNVDSFSYASAYLPNVGYEPKAVGYAFYAGFKDNTLSPALKGQDGVAYLQKVGTFKKEINPNEGMVFYQQMMMEQAQIQRSMPSFMQDMLIRHSDVKYYNDNIR